MKIKNLVSIAALTLVLASSPAVAWDGNYRHGGHSGNNNGNNGGRGYHSPAPHGYNHGTPGFRGNHNFGHDRRWRSGWGPFGYGPGWFWMFAPPIWFVPGVTQCQEVDSMYGPQVECLNVYGYWEVVN